MASVKKREGYGWEVRYVDPATGKRPSKTFELKKDADVYKRKVEREIEDGLHVAVSDSATIGKIADEYLNQREAMRADGRLSAATLTNDGRNLRRYILPALAGRLARDLKPTEVDTWIRSLRTKHRLAIKTAKEAVRAFSHLIDFAVRRRYVSKNVVKEVRGWDEHRGHVVEPVRTFTIDEVRRLLEAIQPVANGLTSRALGASRPGLFRRGETLTRCAIYLAGFCGLRKGEILGLKREHLHLEEGFVEVRHSLDIELKLRPPKTRAGTRDVPLPSIVVAELRAWLDDFAVPNDLDLVFTGRRALPIHHMTLYRYHWHPALKAAGLPERDEKGRSFHFHALRHFAASMLIGGGVPLPDVAALLGHRAFDMTLQVYAHPLIPKSRKRSAFETIATSLTHSPVLGDASVTQNGGNPLLS